VFLDRNQIIPKHYTASRGSSVMLSYPLVTMWWKFSIYIIFRLALTTSIKSKFHLIFLLICSKTRNYFGYFYINFTLANRLKIIIKMMNQSKHIITLVM